LQSRLEVGDTTGFKYSRLKMEVAGVEESGLYSNRNDKAQAKSIKSLSHRRFTWKQEAKLSPGEQPTVLPHS